MGVRHFITTCWSFAQLITELDVFAIMIRKGLAEKTSLTPRAAIYGYCRRNGVDESTWSFPHAYFWLAIFLCTVVVVNSLSLLAWHNSFSFASTASRRLLVRLVVFVVLFYSSDGSCPISIGTGCEVPQTLYLSLRWRSPLHTCR